MPSIRQKPDAAPTGPTSVRRITDALLAVAAFLITAPATAADDVQPLAAIEQVAEEFLAAKTAAGQGDTAAVPLDRRLQLRRCDQPLEAFMRPGARVRQRTIVGVRCNGSRPWKVYVPVNLVVTEPVLVLAKSLPRGHLLTDADLVVSKQDVSRLAGGYLQDPALAIGQRLKQSLRAGSILGPAVLNARTLVKRGQTVILSASSSAISIRMSGKALMDGALNQRIRVENLASGRIVEGLVRSAERVEVLLQ